MQSIPRVVVTLAVVLLALLAGWWLWHFYMIAPWTRDARVRADVVTIAPDVSGWVVELKVRDNQQVQAGDLLMSIDRERYQAALDKARALAETRRQQLNLRQHEASRRVHLGPQAISAELRENAQINAEIARAEFQQAEAEVKLAELNLARSEVRAPRAGQITNLHLAQGNYVQAGQAVMALVADDSFYVQAYFEETKLPGIRVGAPAEVILMRYHRPQRCRGRAAAGRCRADLQLGAPGPAHSGAHRVGRAAQGAVAECGDDGECAGYGAGVVFPSAGGRGSKKAAQ